MKLVKDPSVDVNARDTEDEMNALLKLTRHYGHEDLTQLVRLLIERGIDIDATDPNGWNAFHNLCASNSHNKNFTDLILLLEESNIDMKAKTKEGYTAFSLTALENPTYMTWKGEVQIDLYSFFTTNVDKKFVLTKERISVGHRNVLYS